MLQSSGKRLGRNWRRSVRRLEKKLLEEFDDYVLFKFCSLNVEDDHANEYSDKSDDQVEDSQGFLGNHTRKKPEGRTRQSSEIRQNPMRRHHAKTCSRSSSEKDLLQK